MAGYVDSSTADYDFPMGYNESCSNYNASNTLSTGYSSSTISSSYKYQVEYKVYSMGEPYTRIRLFVYSNNVVRYMSHTVLDRFQLNFAEVTNN